VADETSTTVETTASSSSSTSSPSTTGGTTTSTTTSASATTADTGAADSSGAAETGDDNAFIGRLDGSGLTIECDIWIDDCPPGQKCMPWANDGGNSWNATKCTPIAEQPNGVGEPCTVEGSGVSGIDDCAARAMCWDVDPETNEGTCIAFCNGSEAAPTCGDPCSSCTVWNEGVLILCLPICDPLVQDCSEGMACQAYEDTFVCSPDSGSELGAAGDQCEFYNVCDPGLFCGDAARVPGCLGAIGCCTPFCDALGAGDECAVFPETECIPWFDEGEAPPCFSTEIGGCLLPE